MPNRICGKLPKFQRNWSIISEVINVKPRGGTFRPNRVKVSFGNKANNLLLHLILLVAELIASMFKTCPKSAK